MGPTWTRPRRGRLRRRRAYGRRQAAEGEEVQVSARASSSRCAAAAFGEEWAAEHAGKKYTGTLLNRVEEDGAMLWNVAVRRRGLRDGRVVLRRRRRARSPPESGSRRRSRSKPRWRGPWQTTAGTHAKWTFTGTLLDVHRVEDGRDRAETAVRPGSVDHWFFEHAQAR